MTDRDALLRELHNDTCEGHAFNGPHPSCHVWRSFARAFDAGHAAGERKGAADERAAIVAWLRAQAEFLRPLQAKALRHVAHDIEGAIHRPEPAPAIKITRIPLTDEQRAGLSTDGATIPPVEPAPAEGEP